MMMILDILIAIVRNTPLWVWLVLVILVQRGRRLLGDTPVSLAKSLIMPSIFIIWGLDKVILRFSDPGITFSMYLPMIGLGAAFGYWLYRNKKYYIRDGRLFQQGCRIPLIVMMVNFSIKYVMNVYISIFPNVCHVLSFNMLYGIISGFTVGLFFGGIIKTLCNGRMLTERRQ